MHFFDYNATTPLLPEAKAAWLEAVDAHWLNPSSPYRAAAAVHARLEKARERVAELFQVSPERVVFNSGATEGNNFVFAAWQRLLDSDARVGVGETEHPSVVEAAKLYFDKRVNWIGPGADGVVDRDQVDLSGLSALSIMAANNETGMINPWQELVDDCHEKEIWMHCDASQWIGKMPLDGLGACDFLTGCAHKFGGPKGVGFLLLPENTGAGLVGGVQEGGRRAGTEDVPGILSMVAALEAAEEMRSACSEQAKLSFLGELKEVIPGVKIIGEQGAVLWNTASVILPKFKSSRWIRALEKRGFLVSAGSACSSGKKGPSHVLAAMGVDAADAERVLRISSGWQTKAEDWSALLSALQESYESLKSDVSGSGSKVIQI